MRHKFFLLVSVLLLLSACNDQPVAPNELPLPIQQFVKQHFPDQPVALAMKDWEWFSWEYDLALANGTEINFDTDNEWEKVNCLMKAVPAALVPAPIATYVNTTFPSVFIVKIEKDRFGYEVELSNGFELKFNRQGALQEMDD